MALTLLLGGARSGKSALALRYAESEAARRIFIATAEPGDAEMRERIDRHRAERAPGWSTVEAPLELAEAIAGAPADACVVVDCLTLWTSNLLARDDSEAALVRRAAEAADLAAGRGALTIAVSNEVGMGVVPDHPLGRRFRDLLGRVNRVWAERAERAELVVAGRVLGLEAAGDG